MEQSILKSTKKVLGVGPDDDSFDLDIITHINSAFSTLNDVGIGPPDGFVIEDESGEWEAFLPENPIMLSKVKTVVYLRVRLVFDPPQTSFVMDALQKQLEEAEWRLSVNREARDWEDPDPLRPDATIRIPVDTHFADG
jgi:hypothetical protein